MSEPNEPGHWKSIADAVGADLPEEAFQPEVPAAPEASDALEVDDLEEQASDSPLEPVTGPSAEKTAAKLPSPPRNDWDDLANQLGIEVPEPPTSPVVEEFTAPAATEAATDLDALMGAEEIFEADLVDEDEPEAAENLSYAVTEQETQIEEDPFAAFAAFHAERSEKQTPEVEESSANDRVSTETVATREDEVVRETQEDSSEATVEAASDDDEDRSHRRRRRRRRHRQRAEEDADVTDAGSAGVKSDSDSDSDSSEAMDEEKLESETRPERKKRSRRSTGAGDEEKSSRKRNIPSWEEAIAVVVEANIVNHSKTSSRESRGGRGRGRGRGSRKS
ncbi:MAG: hypothetical protein MK165_06335 [Pirellulaceae bacterium]|nr:hypothetical protein [Pirellulaceae bacterium]